jgi:hypothetical protein
MFYLRTRAQCVVRHGLSVVVRFVYFNMGRVGKTNILYGGGLGCGLVYNTD